MADFIGVSSYPAMVLGQSTLDIESPQKMNMVELSGFGVYMQQMIAEGKEVIISETGELASELMVVPLLPGCLGMHGGAGLGGGPACAH